MKCIVFLTLIILFHLKGFANNAKYIHEWNQLLIDLMVKDGFSPVLATRGFVYPNIAAYHALSYFDTTLKPLNGKLNGFHPEEIDVEKDELIPELVMVEAIYKVSKAVMYREMDCTVLYNKQVDEISADKDDFIVRLSKSFGQRAADYVISWMKKDGYNETKALPNYIFLKGTYNWQPTPPEFRNALEPNWKSLRPFVIDTPAKYTEPLTVTPDSAKSSEFYKLAIEVYDLSKKLTPEQKLIAEFWDDNPDLNDKYVGHIGMPRRHINPASHWVSILKQLCVAKNISLPESVRAYMLLTVAEADAKIVVWHDKYTFNLIRPVTYIRRYIDEGWMPHLVTPPFPEHTSGHSACSMACAEVLTAVFGDNVSFSDETMVKYLDLPVRTFPSFKKAALEVSESRILGGIHYRTAVDAGMKQGEKIGKAVIKNLLVEE